MIVELVLRAAPHLHVHPEPALLAAAAAPSLQPPRRRPARCSRHEEEEEEEEEEYDDAGSIEGGLHSPLLLAALLPGPDVFGCTGRLLCGGGALSADAQDDIERVQGEIPEGSNKITQVEGEMKACINNAEKLRLQSRLERVKNAEA